MFVRCVCVVCHAQFGIPARGISRWNTPEPFDSLREMSLFGPLLTQSEPVNPHTQELKLCLADHFPAKNRKSGPENPHTQELKLLIGGSFSGEKSQIGTRKSAHSGTKTVDWRIVLLKQNDPVIISYLV